MAKVTRECLLTMRDTIVKYGWTQGCYGNEYDGYCLLGAYSKACLGWDIEKNEGQEPAEDFGEPLEETLGISDIAGYNDYELENQAEVIKLLETKAAQLP